MTRYNWNEPQQQTQQRIADALERIADALEAPATPAGVTGENEIAFYPPVPAPRASHEVKRLADLTEDHTRLEDIG